MPGPFPGMDPYLEHPALWPGVHQRLITNLATEINRLLPPHYVADIGERLYVVQPQREIYAREIYPDVVVQRPSDHAPVPRRGGAATASAIDPPWIVSLNPVEVREVFIQIIAAAGGDRVVTALEILSRSNKAAGSDGRRLYLEKQSEILESETHLVEIDLLRAGEHTVAVPREALDTCGPWNYLVSLHRGRRRFTYEVWGIPVLHPLPRISVPLAGDDEDLVLDLQPVFDRCYDEGAYARRIDYNTDPSPPLSPADAAHADALLREKGLRA